MFILNDKQRPLIEGQTVHDLLKELNPQMPIAVVKINNDHVPRRTWKERTFQANDTVRVNYIIAGG